MPVGIAMASIVGIITVLWLIKRSRAEPEIEFRQDTMRYLNVDPDRKARHLEHREESPPAREQRVDKAAVDTVPASVVSEHETSEIEVALKPVFGDENPGSVTFKNAEVGISADEMFESQELLLNDE